MVGQRTALLVAIGMLTVSAVSVNLSGEGSATELGELRPVPDVAKGFAVEPLASLPVPTAINWGPDPDDDDDGYGYQNGYGPLDESPDLYATTLTGDVYRLDVAWTPAGPTVQDLSVFASGFNQPLGIAFDEEGIGYVAASHNSPHPDRGTDGVVYWLDEQGDQHILVDGLPNGRHNTNHLRMGPTGDLWIPNGNPDDNGQAGGDDNVYPYSGAFLSVDPDALRDDPAVFAWFDADGDPIPDEAAGVHPANEDFGEKVTVEAFGFRNIFGVAFGPDDVAYTGMNGADAPSSQDVLYRLDEEQGTFYGFPFCFDEGSPGAVGDDITKALNPTFPDYPNEPDAPGVDEVSCEQLPTADALLGWHVCATGIDFPTEGPWSFPNNLLGAFHDSVYVGECAVFFAGDWVDKTMAEPTTHNTAHTIARIALDEEGNPTQVRDFVKGLALPTDVRFGPQGAMYIADAEGILRVAPIAPAT